jgi:DNA polymerase-4
MELELHTAPPEVMHIDLNSAFAMTEQQANPLLRGRPVGVTNRLNDFAICIAASHEAKLAGIGLGTRRREGRMKAPNFVMVESDAPKYQYVHRILREIFSSYSPVAYMKSVDEGVIDFRGMRGLLKGRTLEDIGYEIKHRVREEVGDYMKVNVGIAQNRWLAKVAAGFMKPDGLYVIDHTNVEAVYSLMGLVELPYIKRRNQVRLNEAGIFTPLEFLRASEVTLTRRVFRSIVGHHWYLKLRGYETEVEYGIRTVGRSYVLEHRTADREEIATLLHKASVKVSRRLARNKLAARGLMMWFTYLGNQAVGRVWGARPHRFAWRGRKMYTVPAHRSDQIYQRAMELFDQSPPGEVLASLMITAYALEPTRPEQLSLYDDDYTRAERLDEAVNVLNDRYGELMVAPASVFKSKNPMKDKIPFGSIRYFT